MPTEQVTAAIAQAGSLIAAIEALREPAARLRPYAVPELSSLAAWLAESEVLDPEGPDEMFEPLTRCGLFRGGLLRRR